ncbi:MAG TPA: response regulator transcription factor [Bryobacteraceae bacterium]|nr:response regulator transcription factor [Bryobacteraceae bacterium]
MSARRTAIRVAIADSQDGFREHMRRVLDGGAGIEVVGDATDAGGALELAARTTPDVLLVELAISRALESLGSGGRDHLRAGLRSIVSVTSLDSAHIFEALKIGAQGVVLKTSPAAVWLNSIQTVASGHCWLAEDTVAILVQALQNVGPSAGDQALSADYSLTRREIEIVEKIAGGLSNKEVGREFSIRERTVKHHLTNIYQKIGVSSRLELALFARDRQIVPTAAPGQHGARREEESPEDPAPLPASTN